VACSEPGGPACSQGTWRGAGIVLRNCATSSPPRWSSRAAAEPWRRQGSQRPRFSSANSREPEGFPPAKQWGCPRARKSYGSKWQKLLLCLCFQPNVKFYHSMHGRNSHPTVENGKENICNQVKPPPVAKIHVTATQDLQRQQKQNTEQAPNTEIKENSLTSKELCKGTA